MLDRTGFQAMRDIHPATKLIFILRNPADRFWTSMKFNRKHNPAFDIDIMFDRLIEREDFKLLADYGLTLREALSVFPPESVHVEFYEKLFDQTAVDRICRFAGIASRPADFGGRSNASLPGDMPPEPRAKAVRAYAHVYRDIAERFGGDLPQGWCDDLASLSG